MVQILERGPSFGESFISTLGEGLKNYQSYQAKQNDEKLIGSLNDPNLSDMERIGIASKLSPERQKGFLPLYSDLMQTQQKMGLQQHEANIKQQHEALEEAKSNEEVRGTINELSDKLFEGGTGAGWAKINKLIPSGREKRAYFDELGVGIEKRLSTMLGKGSLSEVRFNYLMGLLPNSNYTDATNRGKLKALWKEFKGEGEPEAFGRAEKKKAAAVATKKQELAALEGNVWVISPNGEEVQIPKDQLDAALASGGQLP